VCGGWLFPFLSSRPPIDFEGFPFSRGVETVPPVERHRLISIPGALALLVVPPFSSLRRSPIDFCEEPWLLDPQTAFNARGRV